jgi:hypothetical protein
MLRVHVVDDSSGSTIAARVYLSRATESILPPGLPSYARGDERHFLVTGDFELDLRPGPYKIRIERGLEYIPEEIDVEVPGRTSVAVRLRRWIDMQREGWYSADMHVHRDPADIPLILRAEDLAFVPTITTHIWSNDVNYAWKGLPEYVTVVEQNRFFTSNGQEIERIQGGPGAVILLAPGVPLPFEGYEFYPPAMTYARRVHEMGGIVEGDKPFWVDTFVNAALGGIDAIEINCNHFLPRLVDTDLAPWSHWPIEFGYRGNRGFALWMMDLYYRILNSGIELPLSAGSANGVKATPVGYDRVYVRHAGDSIDHGVFVQALKAGRSFSTNGPIVEMEADSRYGPGDRIEVRPGQRIELRGRARSRRPLEVLQVIVNGKVVAEQNGQATRELLVETTITPDRSAWAAVRAFESSGRSEVFGHTSPMYFTVGGQPVVVSESVRDLIQKIDLLIGHTEHLEGFRDEAHRSETLDVYRAARAVLSRRLEQR